jgi:protein phosphatase
MMKAVVQHVSFPKGKRVVAVSDIHGSYDVLKKLLEKISFSSDDILVLVGDVLEKGSQNLETLRFLVNLSKTHLIYKVAGNVDILYEDIFETFTRENGETLLSYLMREDRRQGLLHQMSREIGFPISENMDLDVWRKALLEHFPRELEFLRGWPHILESEKLIFVHGGLTSGNLEEQQAWKCRKNDFFMSQGLSFAKMVVVGHFPVTIYMPDGLLNQNPVINRRLNICSIDGGMVVKSFGQLNALMISDGDPKQISYTYSSPFPMVEALDAQGESQNPKSIVWGKGRNLIEEIQKVDEFTLCRQTLTGEEFWILNEQIYTNGKGLRCAGDTTNYYPEIHPGDSFCLLRETSRGHLILKDGVIGWYKGRLVTAKYK